MPFLKEKCPHCGHNVHGITTSKGACYRCGICELVWTQQEFADLTTPKPKGIQSALVSGPGVKTKPSNPPKKP